MRARRGQWLGICAGLCMTIWPADRAEAQPASHAPGPPSKPTPAGKQAPAEKPAPAGKQAAAGKQAPPATASAATHPESTAKTPAAAGPKKHTPARPKKETPRKTAVSKHVEPREKPAARVPGSAPGKADEAARQALTGRHQEQSSRAPAESLELKEMREVDAMLFPPKGTTPFALAIPPAASVPEVNASGLPPAAPGGPPPDAGESTAKAAAPDRAWLAKLELPEFPVRFDAGVVRYLEYYRDNPRGRRLVAAWIKKSGRYRQAIVKVLREHKLPEDLVWLALVESGFDPGIHSHAGAAGLWQFMPATGRVYGLTVQRRVDERLDPERSTHAAATHLKDLYTRFGTWELAFAAYNMGYGGLLASIRKYNTNDYWELRRLEAGLPYETALYVPKIVSMAIVARNCAVFGCDGVSLDSPEPFGETGADKVAVAPGVTLEDLATAVRAKPEQIASLNPHLIGSRLPPLEHSATPRTSWTAYVPEGKGTRAATLPAAAPPRQLRTHRVRWGESLAHIATRYRSTTSTLENLNDLHDDETPRPGTAVFVPNGPPPETDAVALAAQAQRTASDKQFVVVPDRALTVAERRRVFYQVVYGDTVEDVARVSGVSANELRRWNHLDSLAVLQAGMHLQLFIATDAAPADVLLLEDEQVVPLRVASDEFFSHFVGQSGRERIEVTAGPGETWKDLAKRHNVTLGSLERINHKSRSSKLNAGDRVVVYVKRRAESGTRAELAPARAVDAPPPPAPTTQLSRPDGATDAGSKIPSAVDPHEAGRVAPAAEPGTAKVTATSVAPGGG